jgi:hypothetical protein
VPPTSIAALLILIAAVLPGAAYTWAFERQASGYGVTLADRVLRFIATSVLFHLVFGWPEYFLYRIAFSSHHLAAGQFAAAWAGALVVIGLPAVAGTITGGLYATRTTRDGWQRIRRHLSSAAEERLLTVTLGRTPAPRAWDALFSNRPTVYIRIRTIDGTVIAGLFADRSYAAGYPDSTDLYLEEAWSVEDDGSLGEALGYPVYVAASQIGWMEIIQQSG